MGLITDAMSNLMMGFGVCLQPFALIMTTVGLLLGLVIGVLPGLGGTAGVALLLPISVLVPREVGIMFLTAIYWGALFGGVITSVLFAIPGEPWSVPLIFDGYPMAKKGEAGLALTAAFFSSFLGMLVAATLFTLAALPIAMFALRFGPPEMFAIMFVAFSTFVGLGTGEVAKTLISTAIGLLLTTVGLDIVTGQPRLCFGSIAFLSGFHFVPVTIGIFGLGEILANAEERTTLKLKVISAKMGLKDIKDGLKSIKDRIGVTFMGIMIGFFVGVLPGAGAAPAAFVSYGVAKQYSKHPERYGEGTIEGVIAPQSAANSAGIASLLPLITLGIPGSATAAVLMSALFMYGLWPGPRLFTEAPEFCWGLMASLYVANALCLIICLAGTPILASIMRVPWGIITPIIILACLVGSFVMRNLMLDVWTTLIFGLLGYFLKKMKYPLAPLAVALVLGGMAEEALRQSLLMGYGSVAIFFERPLTATIMGFAFLLFLLPLIRMVTGRVRTTLKKEIHQ